MTVGRNVPQFLRNNTYTNYQAPPSQSHHPRRFSNNLIATKQATSVNADANADADATATGDVIGQLIIQQSATADI